MKLHRHRWRLAAAMLLVAALACPVFAQTKTLTVGPKSGEFAGKTFYTNSHALIIGISQYQFLPKEKWLAFAAQDAKDVRDVLVCSYGFLPENVTVLLNEQATKKNIEDAFASLADEGRVKTGDRVLVFFSGHGQTVKLQSGGDMGFLIPFDAKVDLQNPDNQGPYLASCLRMDNLWGYLEVSPAKHRLLIADACFGGLVMRGRTVTAERPSPSVVATLLARPAQQVLTAGGKNEEAQEDPKLGHGYLSYKLLEELKARAANPDSVFVASQLASSLKTSVANLTNAKQTPQFGDHNGTEGDFVFMTTEPQQLSSLSPTTNASADDLFKQGLAADGKGDPVTAYSLYHRAAEAGSPGGMSNLARVYSNGLGVAKDVVAAYKWYRKAADVGKPLEMISMGRMYEYGQGVPKDYEEAVKWYRKSADAGYPLGMICLGIMYQGGHGVAKDYDEAAKWYRKAADVGYPLGMGFVGGMYEYGLGVSKDYVEAAKWYRKAADAGDPSGMMHLGVMYEGGQGVAKDLGEAVKWYRRAAAAGSKAAEQALERMGVMYEHGQSVPNDVEEKINRYRKSAEAGNPSDMHILGSMYEYGLGGVTIDFVEAVKWYRKAAESGYRSGMDSLGCMYEYGRGVPKDVEVAIRWFRKAADAGEPFGMMHLGVMYEGGQGVAKDLGEAVKWYRKAADAGSPVAMSLLGSMYETGRGVPKDVDEAVKWYRKAAGGGYDDAAKALERLGR